MMVHNVAVQWAQLGHTVLIANMISGESVHPEANYRVKLLWPPRGSDRFGMHRQPWRWVMETQLKRLLTNFAPDYISGHFAYPCGVWLGNIQPQVPWTITCHAADVNVLKEYNYGYRLQFDLDDILARSLAKATRVIAVSDYIRRIVSELGISASSIVRIPNGADSRLRDVETGIDIRAMIDIPATSRYVVSVGRHYYAKGFEQGIAAFARVADKLPGTYYLFVGQGTSELKAVAEKFGIGSLVRFCEQLNGAELRAAYQQACLFFSPSRIEGFPCVGAEAVMAGLPVLATDSGGNPELVKEGVNGRICITDDTDSMAENLYALLADSCLLQESAQGSQGMADCFDWGRIAQAYLHEAGVDN